MNFLPPDSELTDPHDEINDMRLRWDIRFSEAARGRASSSPLAVWGLLAAAAALAIGAVGPWETAFGLVSHSGLEGSGAIVIVASGALAAGAVLCARHPSVGAAIGCLIASVAGVLIAGAEYRETSARVGEDELLSVGWGLQLVLVAGVAAAVLSLRVLLEARRSRR